MRCSHMQIAVAIALLSFSLTYAAGVSSDQSFSIQSTPASVTNFASPEGHFDPKVTGTSQNQGPLKLEGVEVSIDPLTDEPIFRSFANLEPLPDDVYWNTDISAPYTGVSDNVYCSILFDGKLIIGGKFAIAAGKTVNQIAAWDGETWTSLGVGTDNTVLALAVMDGKLYAGGHFTMAGGVPANHVACWDGATWSALGVGVDSTVRALSVFDGQLVAAGDFSVAGGVTTDGVAVWDGAGWSSIGSEIEGTVAALIVYDNQLIAGGNFTVNGDTLSHNLAGWDGTQWAPLKEGLNVPVNALLVHNGKLIVGGYRLIFIWSGYWLSTLLSEWDGDSWSDLLDESSGYEIFALSEQNGKLLVGGNVRAYGCDFLGNVSSFDGESWFTLESGPGLTDASIRTLAVFNDTLIAGGVFQYMNGVGASHIAQWDGTNWTRVNGDHEFSVSRALAEYQGELISEGNFSNVGGDFDGAKTVASWNGTHWRNLGPDLYFWEGCLCPAGLCCGACIVSPYARVISSFAHYHGNLIIGGGFTIGDSITNVARLDGSTWSSLGYLSMDYSSVSFLAVFQDKLITNGQGLNIAVYDGSTWTQIARPFTGFGLTTTIYGDKLVFGGWFYPRYELYAWDGSSWSTIGSELNLGVEALATYQDQLVAAGNFTIAGGEPVNHIAAWDGSAWQPLGDGLDGEVTELVVYDGQLIAGGRFVTAGGLPANHVAAWDGEHWAPLGSGVDGEVTALYVYHNNLVVAGYFTSAGGKIAPDLAIWTKHSSESVTLDVKPGSCQNPINGNSAHGQGKAVLPVAIMGSDDFDVHDIDPTTITLNGTSPVRWNYDDVGAPPDDLDADCPCSETGPDGYVDLTFKFHSADIVASLGDDNVVWAEGQLYDGTSFEGHDCVTVVGNIASKVVASDNQEREFEVVGNYPNPFNPSTRISFSLPAAIEVKLEIFNVLGQRVSTLIDQTLEAGNHSVDWDGSQMASGIYYYRLQAGDHIATNKMLLLK